MSIQNFWIKKIKDLSNKIIYIIDIFYLLFFYNFYLYLSCKNKNNGPKSKSTSKKSLTILMMILKAILSSSIIKNIPNHIRIYFIKHHLQSLSYKDSYKRLQFLLLHQISTSFDQLFYFCFI